MRGRSSMTRNIIKVVVLIFFIGMVTEQCFAVSIKESVRLYERGKRQYDRENYTKAIDYFRKAITDCPENAMIEVTMYYLGSSYEKSGKYDMAVSIYQEFIEKYGSGYWVKLARKNIESIEAR